MLFSTMESTLIKSVHERFCVAISTAPSVEIAKTSSLLQVTQSFKQLSQCDVWPFSSIKTTLLSVKWRFLALSVKTGGGLH